MRFSLPYLAPLLLALAIVPVAYAQEQMVLRIRIDAPITSVTADYLDRALDTAMAEDASALLVELDTPGGDSGAMQRMAGDLLNAPLPTLVWVGPEGAQAASAGTFIVLAAHAAGMAPRTVIGAASPVGSGGEDLPDTLGRKATEDFAAAARSYARRRGSEAEAWAERAVREAVSATAEEAEDIGIVDVVAASPQAFLEAVDGLEVQVEQRPVTLTTAGARLRSLEMTPGESLLSKVANPAVAVLLITLAVNAILIELSNPGGYVAGIIGSMALAIGLYSLGILEANLVGLVFMAAAFALFLLDVKSGSGGLMSAAGIGLFIVGAVVLFVGGPFGIPWLEILTVAAATALFMAFVVGAAFRAQRRPPAWGAEALIGAKGEVTRSLEPDGAVRVEGEIWEATSAGGDPISDGARIVVVSREGFRLTVTPLAGPADSIERSV